MKMLLATVATLTLIAGVAAHAETMIVQPNGSRPTIKGPEAYFTGSVTVDRLFEANEQTSNTGALVSFEPSARSAWHTHPAGQTLIVTHGTGWVQEEGGAKRKIQPGDVVWTPPGIKHWHGASSENGMSHIAITNMLDGQNVVWMEKVTDDHYASD